jgi:hypothetical protein
MKLNLAILSVALTQAFSLSASANQRIIAKGTKQCFARTYTDEHLERHPGQQPQSMVFELEWKEGEGAPRPVAALGVNIRGAFLKAPLLFCSTDSSSSDLLMRCGVPCDGGGVEVGYRDNTGTFYVKNLGIALERGCDANEGSYWFDDTPENTLFALEPVPCL